MTACAVWYWRYHVVFVDLFDNEEDAAQFAMNANDNGEAAIAGVQYPSGVFTQRDAWTALADAERRERERWEREFNTAKKRRPPKFHTVQTPFLGQNGRHTATIPDHYPEWIGHHDG